MGDAFRNLNEQVSETKEKVQEMGRGAAQKIDYQRERAASAMDEAAAAIDERAERLPGGRRVADAAHATASGIGSAARYLHDHDLRSVGEDLEEFIRRHPAESLATAAVAGFLVGWMFRREEAA